MRFFPTGDPLGEGAKKSNESLPNSKGILSGLLSKLSNAYVSGRELSQAARYTKNQLGRDSVLSGVVGYVDSLIKAGWVLCGPVRLSGERLCRKLRVVVTIFLNDFQWAVKECGANSKAKFAFAKVIAGVVFSIRSKENADAAAQELAELKAQRICQGLGNLYLLCDHNGNLVVNENSKVIIAKQDA